MHDICLHPEYVSAIRAELESGEWESFEKSGRGLPLLDGFIKESARTTPVESSKLAWKPRLDLAILMYVSEYPTSSFAAFYSFKWL